MTKITGKVAIVTGAGQGVGRGTALALARAEHGQCWQAAQKPSWMGCALKSWQQAVYPHMKQRGGGAIINLVSSTAINWDTSRTAAYSAKQAIGAMTRASSSCS